MGDKKICGGRPQLGEAVCKRSKGKRMVSKERTDGDNVELKERDDLLLYVE